MQLLDLPHELLLEIFSHLHKNSNVPNEFFWITSSAFRAGRPEPDEPHIPTTLQTLPLVHLALHPILNPLLFSNFTLTFNEHHVKDLASLRIRLRNFAQDDSAVGGYVRNLTLTAYRPQNDQYHHKANDQATVAEVQAIAGEFCLRVMKRFPSLRQFHWDYSAQTFSKEVADGIVEHIAAFADGGLERLGLNVWFLGERSMYRPFVPGVGYCGEVLEEFDVNRVPRFERSAKGGGLRAIKISGRSGGGGSRGLYSEIVIAKAKQAIRESPKLSSLEIEGGAKGHGSQYYIDWCEILPVPGEEMKPLGLKNLDMKKVTFGMDIAGSLLQHLRQLTSLKLASFVVKLPNRHLYPDKLQDWRIERDKAIGILFQGLQREEVWLRKIHLEGISHHLADYLDSYPVSSQARVHELNVDCADVDSADVGNAGLINEIAVRFWSSLEKHASSLQRLKIHSPYHSKFCYCPEAASVLYRCSNLQYLAYPGITADGESAPAMAVILPELLQSCRRLKECNAPVPTQWTGRTGPN